MASSSCATKRAKLRASKAKWPKMDDYPEPITRTRDLRQDSVRQWLFDGCRDDGMLESSGEPAAQLRRHTSNEDDLALGVEAALYGKQTAHRNVQEFLRCPRVNQKLPRWNSITSAISANSGTLSVMDVLNLWHDDPEELLLDLGFGCDEPDISVKIPARFINHPSQARGINIQVFLEAQKNRIDVENPDISNRFRQLEVLQQVTTAFSSLVAPQPSGPVSTEQLSSEAREKRKRLGMLLRRASKKTLSQMASTQEPCSEPHPDLNQGPRPEFRPELRTNSSPELQPGPQLEIKLESRPESHPEPRLESHPEPRPEPRPFLKRVRQFQLPEGSILSPLVEEQAAPQRTSFEMEGHCATAMVMSRKRSPGDKRELESFEMEEIQSFDEGSIAGSVLGPVEGSGGGSKGVVRTNSCQSDSSGFLEEPVVPSLSQIGSPAPDLMKVLHAMSGDSNESQGTLKASLDLPSPTSGLPQPAEAESELLETPSTTGIHKDTDTSINGEVSLLSTSTAVDLGLQEENPPPGADLGASPEDGIERDARRHSSTEVDSEPKLLEETVSLPEDCAEKGVGYQLHEDSTPIETHEQGPSDSVVTPSATDALVKEKPSFVLPQRNLETVFTRSLSDSKVADADPSSMCRGPGAVGDSKGRPDWLVSRSVSVQMPSSLVFVSHTASSRGSPPTTRSSKGSLHRRAWSDHERPQSTDYEEMLTPPSMGALPHQHSWHEARAREGSFHTRSTSLDTGLAHEDEEEEMGDEQWEEDAEEDEDGCCCRCHHRCSCCPPKALHHHCGRRLRRSVENRPSVEIPEQVKARSTTFPYSIDELDGMMRCARMFRTVLADLEQRLGEEQSSLYGELTEEERAEVQLVQELRSSVRKEAMELELQLTELAHHYDQGFKTKMHQLLDEQSYLCAQLKLCPIKPQVWSPAASLISASRMSPAPPPKTRTVATQCSLLPWPPQGGREVLFHGQRPKPDRILGDKQSKLDFVVFLQSLREPLQCSFTRDPLK
ncbi:coiled-coil domain-containing protein 129 [Arapaima gigas]